MKVKETNKFNERLHAKHEFINKIRIISIHNEIYKETHEHQLIIQIIIS